MHHLCIVCIDRAISALEGAERRSESTLREGRERGREGVCVCVYVVEENLSSRSILGCGSVSELKFRLSRCVGAMLRDCAGLRQWLSDTLQGNRDSHGSEARLDVDVTAACTCMVPSFAATGLQGADSYYSGVDSWCCVVL